MTDISRDKATALRAKLEKDREQAAANLNAVVGAIQALDLLLAPDEPAKTDQ